jgi:hypothetical protein
MIIMDKEKLIQKYRASIYDFSKKLHDVEPHEISNMENWKEHSDMLKAASELAKFESTEK